MTLQPWGLLYDKLGQSVVDKFKPDECQVLSIILGHERVARMLIKKAKNKNVFHKYILVSKDAEYSGGKKFMLRVSITREETTIVPAGKLTLMLHLVFGPRTTTVMIMSQNNKKECI